MIIWLALTHVAMIIADNLTFIYMRIVFLYENDKNK